MIRLGAVLLAAILLAGFKANSHNLAGSEWRPLTIADQQVDPDAGIFVRFGGSGVLVGHTGCNMFSGRYHLDGTQIKVTEVSVKATGCPGPETSDDGALLTALLASRQFIRNRARLSLTDENGHIQATFVQTDWD